MSSSEKVTIKAKDESLWIAEVTSLSLAMMRLSAEPIFLPTFFEDDI
jgi:hypothetical protein